jgi:predicted nucleic acid-binding Zn ribbon protein
MPIYVYKFVDTGETIEVQQAFTDDTLTETVHPRTGETMSVKKVFQPVGVTFKGGGFYKTDSRGSSKSTPSTAATAAGGDGGGSSPSSDGGTASTSSTSGTSVTAPPAATAPSSSSSSSGTSGSD